jgi:SAM-dependent methyltransferase
MSQTQGHRQSPVSGSPAGRTAEQAYEIFAPIYDEFNATNNYELWLGEVLLPELAKHGLKRGRALDVGCGTGRAFEPLLSRGWEVVGCDLTPAMLAEARRKFGDSVPLEVADIRELPVFGEFELVWALNDVINYLVDEGDLVRALTGMRANLAPGGLLLFDADTLSLFEASYASGDDEGMSVGEWRWVGQADQVEPGGVFEALVHGGDIEPHIHRVRHYPQVEILGAMAAAGLECLAALGQREVGEKIVLEPGPDEERDHRTIYIARLLQ